MANQIKLVKQCILLKFAEKLKKNGVYYIMVASFFYWFSQAYKIHSERLFYVFLQHIKHFFYCIKQAWYVRLKYNFGPGSSIKAAI